MGDDLYCSESDARSELIQLMEDSNIVEPQCFTAYRNPIEDSLTYKATFVIPTKEGKDEELVTAIMKHTLDSEKMRFSKSEINVEDKKFTIVYIFVEALISPKLS